MSIIRKRNSSLTIINNSALNDRRLSLEAIGLLAWLACNDDIRIGVAPIVSNVFAIGRDKVQRIINELINCGYLKRKQVRLDDGTLGHVLFELDTDDPQP
jgi:hypothetical protein